jgi:hypothetical protein
MVESLLKEFPNVLTLRVRMPIVEDLTYERNFIAKIIKYDKVSQTVACLVTAWAPHWGYFGGQSAVVVHLRWHSQPMQTKFWPAMFMKHSWSAAGRAVAACWDLAMWCHGRHACISQLLLEQADGMLLLGWLLQVIDIPNSMTVLPELIPYSLEMVRSVLAVSTARACGESWCSPSQTVLHSWHALCDRTADLMLPGKAVERCGVQKV